jgi:hypothetical protein
MTQRARSADSKGAIEIIEEAVHLVRGAAPFTLAAYYIGALPFVLGLLYFWADMSTSPFAYRHLAEASLGITFLFLWMKVCQANFARHLHETLLARRVAPLTPSQFGRILHHQAALQPTGLFFLPVAILPILPFPWVFAFYQNLAVLAPKETGGLGKLVKRCFTQAALWPKQNYALLAMLAGFFLFVFLNWCIVCYMLPGLVKTLFGIETTFSRSGLSMLNTTFFAATTGLSYLCVDPIVKAAYVLRCFYGESLKSGEDLKAELKSVTLAPHVAILLVSFWLLIPAGSRAATDVAPSEPANARQIPATELDSAIQKVIQQKKYTWRMPREKVREDSGEEGIIARFLRKVGRMIRTWLQNAWEWILERLRELFNRSRSRSGSGSGYGWMVSLQLLLYTLIAVAIVCLLILLYRALLSRRKKAQLIVAEPVQPIPDLRDENIAADQLPEDGWTTLARELLARGELRLALRAFYLASLAHLAGRNLIRIARFKSNRDYEHELKRRGHSFPGLLSTFGNNVSIFERTWYGLHEIDPDLVNEFAANVERIRTGS